MIAGGHGFCGGRGSEGSPDLLVHPEIRQRESPTSIPGAHPPHVTPWQRGVERDWVRKHGLMLSVWRTLLCFWDGWVGGKGEGNNTIAIPISTDIKTPSWRAVVKELSECHWLLVACPPWAWTSVCLCVLKKKKKKECCRVLLSYCVYSGKTVCRIPVFLYCKKQCLITLRPVLLSPIQSWLVLWRWVNNSRRKGTAFWSVMQSWSFRMIVFSSKPSRQTAVHQDLD